MSPSLPNKGVLRRGSNKVTNDDKNYLRRIILERMTHHYSESFGPGSSNAEQFAEMENRLRQTLSQLPEQQSGEIQHYLDYLFNRSAQLEELYYRSGFLDGVKLCQYLQRKIEDTSASR